MKLWILLRLPRKAILEDHQSIIESRWCGSDLVHLCFLQYHESLHFISGFYLADILVLCRFRSDDNVFIQNFLTSFTLPYFGVCEKVTFGSIDRKWKKVSGRIVYICNTRLQIPWCKRADYDEIDDSERTQERISLIILLVQTSLLPISDSNSSFDFE